MPRLFLAWLVLLNYLLVVGAGLRVGRPEPPFSEARPYVHSAECQHDNYLRLDCFERCNGDQTRVLKQLPNETGWHFLTQLKGLDTHLPLAGQPGLPTAALTHWGLAPARASWRTPAVRPGITAGPDRPPCRG